MALPDHYESSDAYRGELIREGNWRIAVCRDGIQWLLQHRTRAGSPYGPRWESKHYCQTQKALARLWPGSEPTGRAFVDSLPEHIAFRNTSGGRRYEQSC